MTNSSVRIQIDLSVGNVEIEAPAEALDDVFDKLDTFLPRLSNAHGGSRVTTADTPSETDGTVGQNGDSQNDVGEDQKKRRKTGVRKETYKTIELGLSKEQRQDFRSFYERKKPKKQNDQVLTIMAWLKDEWGQESVSADHLYTGFRMVNAKVPGKISSVLGNLVGTGSITGVGNGLYQLTHVGEDHVEYELPKEEKNK